MIRIAMVAHADKRNRTKVFSHSFVLHHGVDGYHLLPTVDGEGGRGRGIVTAMDGMSRAVNLAPKACSQAPIHFRSTASGFSTRRLSDEPNV